MDQREWIIMALSLPPGHYGATGAWSTTVHPANHGCSLSSWSLRRYRGLEHHGPSCKSWRCSLPPDHYGARGAWSTMVQSANLSCSLPPGHYGATGAWSTMVHPANHGAVPSLLVTTALEGLEHNGPSCKSWRCSLSSNRLDGLVVKVSASRAEDPRFESRLRRDFFGSSHTSDSKIGTSVATLKGAWRYRVSTGTGRPGVSILWLGEVESLISRFYLSMAARTIVRADPSLRYTCLLLGG